MPRFGKDYKMYPRILPSMVLDVTDVIEDCEYCRLGGTRTTIIDVSTLGLINFLGLGSF